MSGPNPSTLKVYDCSKSLNHQVIEAPGANSVSNLVVIDVQRWEHVIQNPRSVQLKATHTTHTTQCNSHNASNSGQLTQSTKLRETHTMHANQATNKQTTHLSCNRTYLRPWTLLAIVLPIALICTIFMFNLKYLHKAEFLHGRWLRCLRQI